MLVIISLKMKEVMIDVFEDLINIIINAGINDGAAVLLLMREDAALTRGLKPLARIVASACAGVDPTIMGTGIKCFTNSIMDEKISYIFIYNIVPLH